MNRNRLYYAGPEAKRIHISCRTVTVGWPGWRTTKVVLSPSSIIVMLPMDLGEPHNHPGNQQSPDYEMPVLCPSSFYRRRCKHKPILSHAIQEPSHCHHNRVAPFRLLRSVRNASASIAAPSCHGWTWPADFGLVEQARPPQARVHHVRCRLGRIKGTNPLSPVWPRF